MSTKLKLYVGRKVLDCFKEPPKVTASQLKTLMEVDSAKIDTNFVQMSMSLGVLENTLGISNASQILKIQPDEIIQEIRCDKDRANRRICFQINRDIFTKEIVDNCIMPDLNPHKKKVVVEFSSPNVAKPFHLGHLRSTIIGNFVANLYSYMNNSVVKLNYLGDWGTQFGLIMVGVDKLNITREELQKNPVQLLYESYVHANKLAETDSEVLDKAKEEFHKLESGGVSELDNWKTYIGFTIHEMKNMYMRLGVTFDEYNYESMYSAKDIANIIASMQQKTVLHLQPNGVQVAKVNDKNVTVVKSDGSTLYITRDIAAAVDRFKRHEFDRMYYVVDNSQTDHFNMLKGILHQMNYRWVDRIRHIKFGRVRGMSTRKGNVVFLKDILDETRELMVQRQIKSPTTKVPITDIATSDILGISCVIVNDLKQRRQRDYEFSWDRALQVLGDTGVRLQYTHCRLCSLEKNCGALPARECIPEMLTEPEVIILIRELARFHDVLYKCEEQLESCYLTTYLFQLCNHISKALKNIKIKDQEEQIASQRLLLFIRAREILRQGMTILGLNPLREM